MHTARSHVHTVTSTTSTGRSEVFFQPQIVVAAADGSGASVLWRGDAMLADETEAGRLADMALASELLLHVGRMFADRGGL